MEPLRERGVIGPSNSFEARCLCESVMYGFNYRLRRTFYGLELRNVPTPVWKNGQQASNVDSFRIRQYGGLQRQFVTHCVLIGLTLTSDVACDLFLNHHIFLFDSYPFN